MQTKGTVHVDSTAAIGVVSRRGCGKLRHVRIGDLWIQERVEEGELGIEKVHGEWNPADMMTKGLPEAKMQRFMEMTNQDVEGGRAKEALELKTLGGNETTRKASTGKKKPS